MSILVGADSRILVQGITGTTGRLFAEKMVARLGAEGTSVVVRLSAFILLCIGIQILWGGLSTLIGPVPK